MSLPDVVQRFKSLTTARYRHGVFHNNWQPFPRRLWQRNYYERIIRNDHELDRIREYIMHNPRQL
jgi:putative transposase